MWRSLVGGLFGYMALALEYNRVKSRVGSPVGNLEAVSTDFHNELRVE